MEKFTHPKDAPEGHKWTYEGHPVLDIHEGSEDMLVVFRYGKEPCHVRTNGKGETGFGPRVIDAPREHTFWVNVYTDSGMVHETRESADEFALSTRIACVPLTFKEGEGL